SSDSALRTPRSTLLQSGFEHFAELFAQLEGIHRRYGEGGARDARSLFLDLCDVLDATSINRGHCPGHVRLLGIADARSLDVPHLFVCGLVDGELPFPDPENIYLPHRIATYAGNLRDEQVLALTRDVEPASLYLHLFASLLGKEHLYLSRAKHVDDAERAPSLPLARLERCIGDSTEISGTNAPISQRDVQRMLADKPAMTGRGKDAMRPEWFAPALAGMAATLERDHAELVESPFEGHLGDAGRTVMAERYKETPLYSPSAIETYAACPLKYFFKYGLGVDEPNLPEADVSPMEKGTLLHAVLEQAFLKIREILQDDGGSIHVEANGTKLPLLSLERFEVLSKKPALALLRETFEVCARDCRITAASWRRWVGRTLASLSEGAALRSELSNFLACERKHQGLGLFPWLLEYELGRKEESDAKPLEFKLNDGSKISLRGSIDRVDVLVAGNEPRFVVVRDYKSGRSSLNAGIKSGTRFQLPVYQKFALAAAGGLAAGGFFYHKLADITEFAVDGAYVVPEVKTALAGEDNRKQWKQPDELLNEHLPARLSALFAAMKAGRFHPTLVDGEKSCAYCGYRGACQVRHEKQRRLHQRGAELRDQLGVYFPEAL
ncbi:MAG: PD-(D/E)XK nuclease family protein, partial [Planctomycetes bacterium]|nr:PD-(D/E)XK nuclease family protein [Planctomycetota bacterium]